MNKIEHIGIAVKNLSESNDLFKKLFGDAHYKIEEAKASIILHLQWTISMQK